MRFLLFSILVICFSCKNSKSNFEYKLSKPETKFITGDFDGDKTIDTLIEVIYSSKTNKEIFETVNPLEYEFDTVVDWYVKNNIEHKLSLSKHISEIPLSNSMGLYFLKNIGDINNDKKDEIAIVIDKLDYSRVNSCVIYTLCNDTWKEIKRFTIHEDAFDFYGDKSPIFNEIKAYLENKEGIWYFHDLNDMEYENPEDVGKMIILKLDKCD